MNPMSTNAIAEFLQKGGSVVRVQETIPVTGPEVLDYLLSCGVSAKFAPGNSRAYVCNGKLLSLSKLVEVANGYRRAQELPPFAARV